MHVLAERITHFRPLRDIRRDIKKQMVSQKHYLLILHVEDHLPRRMARHEQRGQHCVSHPDLISVLQCCHRKCSFRQIDRGRIGAHGVRQFFFRKTLQQISPIYPAADMPFHHLKIIGILRLAHVDGRVRIIKISRKPDMIRMQMCDDQLRVFRRHSDLPQTIKKNLPTFFRSKTGIDDSALAAILDHIAIQVL